MSTAQARRSSRTTTHVSLTSLRFAAAGLPTGAHGCNWEAKLSDVAGCLSLHMPHPLAPDLPLSDKSIPVLCLLDALQSNGFEGVGQKIWHKDASSNTYDNRNLSAKRTYLQCVLSSAELLPLVREFPSGEPSSFYEALQLTRRPLAPALGDATYKRIVAEAGGDVVELAALQQEHAPPQVRAALCDAPCVADGEKSDNSAVGDDDAIGFQGAALSASEPPQGTDMIVGDEDARGAGPGGGEAGRLGEHAIPKTVLGQKIIRMKGRHDQAWSYEDRLSVKCSDPLHGRCSKSRSLAMDADKFGPLAAVYYLGPWLKRSRDLGQRDHRGFVPSRADVQAFIDCPGQD